MSIVLKSVKDWWQEVQLNFTSNYNPNLKELEIPSSFGSGTIRAHQIGKDLQLLDISIKLKERVNFIRQGKADEVSVFSLVFFLSETDITHTIPNQESKLIDNDSGVYLGTCDIPLKLTVPANKEIRVIQIFFTAESLKSYHPTFSLPDKLFQIMNERKSCLYYEPMTWNIKNQVSTYKEHFLLPGYELSWLGLKTLEFVILGINVVGKRLYDFNSNKIFPEDLNQIMLLKQKIENNWEQIPVIDNLAEEINFSRSKLQRLFKMVMGTSIAQFAKKVRLNKAFELLRVGYYTVSDVAVMVGYNSLGHFSNAFKSHHNILPGELLNKEISQHKTS